MMNEVNRKKSYTSHKLSILIILVKIKMKHYSVATDFRVKSKSLNTRNKHLDPFSFRAHTTSTSSYMIAFYY